MRKALLYGILSATISTAVLIAPAAYQVAAAAQNEAPLEALEERVEEVKAAVAKPAEDIVRKAQKALDDNQLEKVLETDVQRGGLFLGLISALTLLYDTVSDTLLYPTFVFLFFVMTCVVIFLGVRLILRYRQDDFSGANFWLFWFSLALLVYVDLFLVIYEKRKILLLFIELQKDILLIALAALAGFIRGQMYSKRDFEENVVP